MEYFYGNYKGYNSEGVAQSTYQTVSLNFLYGESIGLRLLKNQKKSLLSLFSDPAFIFRRKVRGVRACASLAHAPCVGFGRCDARVTFITRVLRYHTLHPCQKEPSRAVEGCTSGARSSDPTVLFYNNVVSSAVGTE
jgi:hypothetical protein